MAPLLPVGLLLTVTLLIRSWGLPGSGLIAYDEGWAARDGRFVLEVVAQPGIWAQLPHGTRFPFGQDFKPGHDLMLGLLLKAGIPPEALPWYSGFAGAVMVIALAALAWHHWGAPAAAVAGVFAGTVPLGVIYSHRVLAEADASAGLALGLYLWDRYRRAPSGRLAIATIFAFIVTQSLNYRFFPTLAIVGALAALHLRQGEISGRLSVLAIAFAPAAAISAVYLLIAASRRLGGNVGLPSWVHDLLIRSGTVSPLPFAFPDFYPRTLWEFGGIAFIVAIALGALAMVRHRKRLDAIDVIAMAAFVGTLLFFSAPYDKAPRALVALIPFAALIAARAVTLWQQQATQWAVAAAVCAACLVNGLVGSAAAREPSGSAAAGRWLAAHQGNIAAARAPIVVLYAGWGGWDVGGLHPERTIIDPEPYATVEELRKARIRWAVVDSVALALPGYRAIKALATCGQPVAEFDDPAGWSRIFFVGGADTLHAGYDDMLAVRERAVLANAGRMAIQIYDLDGAGTSGCV